MRLKSSAHTGEGQPALKECLFDALDPGGSIGLLNTLPSEDLPALGLSVDP